MHIKLVEVLGFDPESEGDRSLCGSMLGLAAEMAALVINTNARKGHATDKAASNERHRIANLKSHAERRVKRAEQRLEGFNRRAAA